MSDLLISTSGARNPLAGDVHEQHDDHDRILAALREHDADAARNETEQRIASTVAGIHLRAD